MGRPDARQLAKPSYSLLFPATATAAYPFSPDDIADPSHSHAVKPSSRRWRFHTAPTNAEESRVAAAFLLDNLCAAGIPESDFHIYFPSTNDKARYIEAQFVSFDGFTIAESVTLLWKNRLLALASSGAPIPRQHTILKVNSIHPTSDLGDVAATLVERAAGGAQSRCRVQT